MTKKAKAKNVTPDFLRRSAGSFPASLAEIAKAPLDVTEKTRMTVVAIEDSKRGKRNRLTLWLHAHVKRTCWLVHALYEYEAWVTTGSDPSSPRFRVDKIGLGIMRDSDHTNYAHECPGTDYCGKSDDVWNTSGACGRTCLAARAWYHGVYWTTAPTCID